MSYLIEHFSFWKFKLYTIHLLKKFVIMELPFLDHRQKDIVYKISKKNT